jgi:hypothetical protein
MPPFDKSGVLDQVEVIGDSTVGVCNASAFRVGSPVGFYAKAGGRAVARSTIRKVFPASSVLLMENNISDKVKPGMFVVMEG